MTVLHCSEIHKVEHWLRNRDTILANLRDRMARAIEQRPELDLDKNEIIEIVEMRFNGKKWVSAKGDNITHVHITVYKEAT